jgi:predicted DNA-binding protein (MmcQ/YjbR family)
MAQEWVRTYCLSLPHVTETVQWGNDLVFKIAGKMFAVLPLDPGGHTLAFKCTAEEFTEFIEQPGIIPAPYLARAHWIALQEEDALPAKELKRLLRQAYDLVYAKLPAKVKAGLSQSLK